MLLFYQSLYFSFRKKYLIDDMMCSTIPLLSFCCKIHCRTFQESEGAAWSPKWFQLHSHLLLLHFYKKEQHFINFTLYANLTICRPQNVCKRKHLSLSWENNAVFCSICVFYEPNNYKL